MLCVNKKLSKGASGGGGEIRTPVFDNVYSDINDTNLCSIIAPQLGAVKKKVFIMHHHSKVCLSIYTEGIWLLLRQFPDIRQ